MGSSSRQSHTHIDITHVRSSSPSVNSQDDELHEHGVHVSPAEISPQYSVIQPSQSQSGSSSHPGEFHIIYPNELGDQDGSDLVSNRDPREHHLQQHPTRSNSNHRQLPRPQQSLRDQPRSRPRLTQNTSPTESGDSTEDFISGPDTRYHPRSQSQYAPDGHYPHSNSSGSFNYPAVPHPHQVGQVIALQPQPMAMPYHPPYPQGPPMPYPPPSAYGGGGYGHPAPGSQISSPYSSPYPPPTMVSYGGGPPTGYFPHQYPHYPQQYQQPYMHYPQQMPPPIPYPEYARIQPPPPTSPPPGSAHASAEKIEKPKEANPEEMFKRFADLMKEERAQAELTKEQEALERAKAEAARAEQEQRIRDAALRQAEERSRQEALRAEEEKRIREQAIIQAAEKARADAAAAAARAEEERRIRQEAIIAAEAKARADAAAFQERLAAEQRIRDEARQEAIRAYEEQVRKAAEQAAREQQIRKEAAEAALKAAADEAAAKADRAAAEKKILEDAIAAAKKGAEKEAAEAAAAAEEKAKKEADEAAAKVKEAEEAAAKATAAAEEAEKKAAAAAPPEKKAPVRFKDAIGRNYNFPWERCHRWRDMEGLINQAFAHIEGIGEHVMHGRYDLIGPDKEIIMPNYWESTVEPDMHITMMLWPIPEPPKEEEIQVPPDFDPDAILNMDDILNPPTGGKKKGHSKKKKGGGGGLAGWMLGGAPRGSRSLKGDKKPEVAAGSQHGAPAQQGSCTVM